VAPRSWGWWTEQKLDILGDYLAAFTTACKRAGQTVYLDLFAGQPDNVERSHVIRDYAVEKHISRLDKSVAEADASRAAKAARIQVAVPAPVGTTAAAPAGTGLPSTPGTFGNTHYDPAGNLGRPVRRGNLKAPVASRSTPQTESRDQVIRCAVAAGFRPGPPDDPRRRSIA
jgi:hypothetical protein